ncbi:unnamed protein product [Sympodiomycopsis kandeliae]
MSDFEDEIDPHAIDPAFTSFQVPDGLSGGLGEELLEAISPDQSLTSTPVKKKRTTTATTLAGRDDSFDDGHLGPSTGSGAGNGLEALGDELQQQLQQDAVEDDKEDSFALYDSEAEEERASNQQARYETVSASLSESVRVTQSFLEQLRASTSGGASSSSSSNHEAATAGTAAAGGMTASVSASSDLYTSSTAAEERLELSGNQIVLSLRQVAKERDSQVRELQEILRALSKPDAALQAAIAETWREEQEDGSDEQEGLPLWLQPVAGPSSQTSDELLLGFAKDSATARISSNGQVLDDLGEEDEEEDEEQENRMPRPALDSDDDDYDRGQARRIPSRRVNPLRSGRPNTLPSSTSSQAISSIPPGPSRKAPISSHLTHLQSMTSSLLISLSHLNESSQITQASFREATKQIRKLRNGLNDWRREVDSADKSLQWIQSQPTQQKDYKSLVEMEIKSFEGNYDTCFTRAKELLQPVQSSIIDSAMAEWGDRIAGITAGIVV